MNVNVAEVRRHLEIAKRPGVKPAGMVAVTLALCERVEYLEKEVDRLKREAEDLKTRIGGNDE